MKSKSPFSKKSPLGLQVYQGDTYERPGTVITKTVGEQVGKAMMGIADNAVDYMNAKGKIANNKQPEPSKSVNSIGLGGKKHEGFGLKDRYTDTLPETPNVNTNLTKRGFSRFIDKDSTFPNLVDVGRKNRGIATEGGKKVLTQKTDTLPETPVINTNLTKGGFSRFIDSKESPNKLIEDTMDPYEQTNKNDITGIVNPNQPQTLGNRDFRFNQDPIAPGRLGSASSVNTQNQIFGGGQAQTAAEQLQTPLYDKGHVDDYDGHTHRKKGKSYKEGDYIDETDFESLNTKLNAYDRGEIQKDKKSQFIVTKNPDFNPVKIDTIRPLKGKTFKMGWGDAERNISTNPKYKQ